jgi:hypothetical protein
MLFLSAIRQEAAGKAYDCVNIWEIDRIDAML